MPNITVVGIVAKRNSEPYVQFKVDGETTQLTVSEARSLAGDLVLSASRAEADAMIVRFFNENKFPVAAAAALLLSFRDFRLGLDLNVPNTFHSMPTEEDETHDGSDIPG